jgi:hypothetical protein
VLIVKASAVLLFFRDKRPVRKSIFFEMSCY